MRLPSMGRLTVGLITDCDIYRMLTTDSWISALPPRVVPGAAAGIGRA